MITRLFLSLTISIACITLITNSAWGTVSANPIAYRQTTKNINKMKLYPMKRYRVQQATKQKNMGLAIARARGLRHPLILPMKVVDPYHQKQENLSVNISMFGLHNAPLSSFLKKQL